MLTMTTACGVEDDVIRDDPVDANDRGPSVAPGVVVVVEAT